MEKKHKTLLVIDGLINVVIGIILLSFPLGIAELLGIPQSMSSFYPTLLGGVVFGIGIALFIERFGKKQNINGLGLAGAIAINFCGGGVLVLWLIFKPLNIPLRGYLTLWVIALIVLGCGLMEVIRKTWKY
jgi:hypothetical protein